MFFRREMANDFSNQLIEKHKHDPKEVREIESKSEGRRKKAYKNYEESCKVKGKFEVRSCPKLEDCFAKNKLKFLPLKSALPNTPVPVTTTSRPKKVGREFIEKMLASRFLNDDENWGEDSDEDLENSDADTLEKRLFKNKTSG